MHKVMFVRIFGTITLWDAGGGFIQIALKDGPASNDGALAGFAIAVTVLATVVIWIAKLDTMYPWTRGEKMSAMTCACGGAATMWALAAFGSSNNLAHTLFGLAFFALTLVIWLAPIRSQQVS